MNTERNLSNSIRLSKFLVGRFLAVLALFIAFAEVHAQTQPQTLEVQTFHAIYLGDQEQAIALIEAGANVDAQEIQGSHLTLLHRAAEKNQLRVAEALVTRGANVNAEVEWFRGIPLTLALAYGHEEMARFLMDHGANAKYVDNAGYTMLHVAAGNVSTALFKLLIDKGCDVNAKSEIGGRPSRHQPRAVLFHR